MHKIFLAMFIFVGLCLQTASTELSVTIGGSEYQGGPAFAVYIGARKIAEGQAADLRVNKRETFEFQIDEELLASSLPLEVRFTNDLKGSDGDRNLLVLQVVLGEYTLGPDDFTVLRSGIALTRNNVLLSRAQDVARASAPAGGWVARRNELSAESTLTRACVGEAAVLFGSGAVGTDGAAMERLDELIVSLPPSCRFEVVGYSSPPGNPSANLSISQQRAQAVAAHMISKGVLHSSVTVSWKGSVSIFGPDAENRRVVVTAKN